MSISTRVISAVSAGVIALVVRGTGPVQTYIRRIATLIALTGASLLAAAHTATADIGPGSNAADVTCPIYRALDMSLPAECAPQPGQGEPFEGDHTPIDPQLCVDGGGTVDGRICVGGRYTGYILW